MHSRISASDLSEQFDTLTVVDVRSSAEYESSHIQGSFNLPLDRLPDHVQDLGIVVKSPVVLVCRSGQRAERAERELLGADLPGLHVLSGGLNAWERAGLPVVRGKQRWAMDRQVRGVASAIILASLVGGSVLPPLRLVAAGVAGGMLVAAITDTCLMARVLAKLPYNRGSSCDVDMHLRGMAERQTTLSFTGAR